MVEPVENGDAKKVRSFAPRPWSVELVERFEQQDKRFEQQSTDIQQVKNDQNMQTIALQGLQKDFAAHKTAADKIGTGVEKILALLGEETEDGDGGWKATGLLGRVRRNENEVSRLTKLYRKWLSWGAGAWAACTVVGGFFITVIWYMLTHSIPKLVP